MKNCIFLPNDLGTFTCPDCGLTLPTDKVKANCKTKMPKGNVNVGVQTPDTVTRLSNFTKAAIEHAKLGNPVVDKEIIKERLEICRLCPLFKQTPNQVGGVCTHSSCGCTLTDSEVYLNKLAWADQECPIGRWGKVLKPTSEGV